MALDELTGLSLHDEEHGHASPIRILRDFLASDSRKAP
jgi:hypothetical protein